MNLTAARALLTEADALYTKLADASLHAMRAIKPFDAAAERRFLRLDALADRAARRYIRRRRAERAAFDAVYDVLAAKQYETRDSAIAAELNAKGLRLANCTESGWYVNTKHGKVWATDLPTRATR